MEENARILCDFGLTLNQAKVYVTIVKLGSSQVGEISKYSEVRREDIYRALPKLEEMGLIEKSLGAPVKIRALPLEEALSLLIKHQQEETSKKMSKLNASAEEFLKRQRMGRQEPKPGEEAPLFSLIPEKEPVLIKTATLIKNSTRQIDIIASRKNLAHFLHLHSDLFKKAVRNGVTIRIVTERINEEDAVQRVIRQNISPSRQQIDLRHIDSLPGHYIIFDAKEALIATATEGDLFESSSLYTRNSGLVEVLQKNFGDIWFFASMPRPAIKAESVPENGKRSGSATA